MVDFIEIQRFFAKSLRDQKSIHLHRFDQERIRLYQTLLYNNVSEILSIAFPIIRSILEPEEWKNIVSEFFENSDSRSPYFHQIPKAFVEFLQDKTEPEYLTELAHYEWAELVLEIADEAVEYIDKKSINPISHIPLISPLTELLAYAFPVHKIKKNHIPDKTQTPHYLIIYRDRNFKIQYLEVNSITARLYQLLSEKTMTGQQAIEIALEEANLDKSEKMLSTGLAILDNFVENDIIIG
ncbi:MAG: DUF2063 domain-containing protein [Gammaproteobacteria bacterium]